MVRVELFELYGVAHATFVGGALHHKIHNVLEPAIFGCHIAHGPRYHNQKEAKWLVEKGFSTVATADKDVTRWIRSLPEHTNPKLVKNIRSLLGATEHILKTF